MINPFIIGKKIYLRSPEPGDEIIYALSENNPAARETLFYGIPTSISFHKEKIINQLKDEKTITLTICTKEESKPVGTTSFFRIDWIGRMATFYIAIAEEENWSKGFGSEVTKLMVDYAFATLNLNRIQLHVCVENEKAVQAYKKTGFKIEGTLKQAMFNNNKYVDFYLMAILKEEWK